MKLTEKIKKINRGIKLIIGVGILASIVGFAGVAIGSYNNEDWSIKGPGYAIILLGGVGSGYIKHKLRKRREEILYHNNINN